MDEELERQIREQAEKEFGLDYGDELELAIGWRPIRRKVIPVVKKWFSDFWNDSAKFTAAMRGLVVALCNLVVAGVIVVPGIPKAAWFASVVLSGLAVGVNAGQTNPTPEEIKGVATDPAIVASPPKP